MSTIHCLAQLKLLMMCMLPLTTFMNMEGILFSSPFFGMAQHFFSQQSSSDNNVLDYFFLVAVLVVILTASSLKIAKLLKFSYIKLTGTYCLPVEYLTVTKKIKQITLITHAYFLANIVEFLQRRGVQVESIPCSIRFPILIILNFLLCLTIYSRPLILYYVTTEHAFLFTTTTIRSKLFVNVNFECGFIPVQSRL